MIDLKRRFLSICIAIHGYGTHPSRHSFSLDLSLTQLFQNFIGNFLAPNIGILLLVIVVRESVEAYLI